MWKFAVTEKLGELSILQLYFSSKTLDSNGNSALAEIGSAINASKAFKIVTRWALKNAIYCQWKGYF